jgi:C4-type Zn-finger protein
MSTSQKLICPHCGEELKPFEMPAEMAWENQIQYACFNDECSYFVKGWDWMWEKYRAKTSYRYRVTDPATGHSSPLPVWSKTAIKDRIIEDAD